MRNLICIVLLLIASTSYATDVGQCITDPNADKLQAQWKKFHDLKLKRAKINASVLVREAKMDKETMRLLQSVSESEHLIKLMDELQGKYLKKAFVDLRFNELISSPDFIDRLLTKKMDEEIRTSELKFKDDENFYKLLDQIRAEVSRPQITDALEIFRNYDLGILEEKYRKSAKSALRLIRKKGASIEEVRKWIDDPPYLRNVPLPAEKLGPFAIRYRTLLKKSIGNFVRDREISLAEAKKLFPRIKQSDVDEMNQIASPVETNSFDENIYKENNKQMAAIDGVLRTLWGEAASCEDQGLNQFEAIGKIIADRSIAVCNAISEEENIQKKNVEVREKNWTTFLKNWAGISRPAPGMQNKAYNKLKGLSDFGRKENINMPCPAQVVSKKNQFSVWNSYNIKKYHSGQFHQNIPDAEYEIKGPQNPNDDKALIRILCPNFINDKQKELWEKAKSIATSIVTDPASFTKKYQWPKNAEVYFYTHEAPLPFAKEIKFKYMTYENTQLMISKKGRGPCNNFRLFVPKVSGQY